MSDIHPPEYTPRNARVGETFGRRVTIDAASIRSFAASVEDFNPLHHDEAIAAPPAVRIPRHC
jgi:acyl dehydratase